MAGYITVSMRQRDVYPTSDSSIYYPIINVNPLTQSLWPRCAWRNGPDLAGSRFERLTLDNGIPTGTLVGAVGQDTHFYKISTFGYVCSGNQVNERNHFGEKTDRCLCKWNRVNTTLFWLWGDRTGRGIGLLWDGVIRKPFSVEIL